MNRLCYFIAALWLLALPASANPIVADISTYHIAIDASFTGIRIFIFGARNEAGDVVVVVRGPQRNVIIRKKEPVGGVWINRDRLALNNVPEYYAVASAKPLEALNASALLKGLRIGTSTILPEPTNGHEQKLFPSFTDAFLKNQSAAHLYNTWLPLGFMGETLFKATIPFPDNIPGGDYTAEIYLISDGELMGEQTMPIRVEKTGFDAAVWDMAHKRPFSYGLLAIALAILAGWSASKLFERA